MQLRSNSLSSECFQSVTPRRLYLLGDHHSLNTHQHHSVWSNPSINTLLLSSVQPITCFSHPHPVSSLIGCGALGKRPHRPSGESDPSAPGSASVAAEIASDSRATERNKWTLNSHIKDPKMIPNEASHVLHSECTQYWPLLGPVPCRRPARWWTASERRGSSSRFGSAPSGQEREREQTADVNPGNRGRAGGRSEETITAGGGGLLTLSPSCTVIVGLGLAAGAPIGGASWLGAGWSSNTFFLWVRSIKKISD